MRKIAVILALLTLFCAAHAEGLYIGGDNLYYHAVHDCLGLQRTATDDVADRSPCPICVEDDYPYAGLEVFRLAGLTIVRMSDAWMAAQTEIEGIFAWTEAEDFTGAEAEAKLSEYLHGDAYAAFKDAVRRGETPEATARYMGNYDIGADFCASAHVGGAWYAVYGAMEYPPKIDHDFTFRFFCGPMSQTGDALTVHICDEWDDYFVEDFVDPPLTVLEDAPVWSQAGDNYALDLYETRGFCLAALRLTGRDALLMPEMTLNAPDWPEPLTAYAADDGGDALYGFMLSAGQAEAMKRGGAELGYRRFEDFELDYQNSPYAVVQTEQEFGDWLVLDRERHEILRSTNWIERSGNLFLIREAESREMLEAAGFSNDFVGFGGFYQNAIIDADSGKALLRGNYLYHIFDIKTGWLEYRTWLDCELYMEGMDAPAAVIKGSENPIDLSDDGVPNPATRFTVFGGAAIYVGAMSEAAPTQPDGCLVWLLKNWNRDDPDAPCAVVAWNLTGGEPPTAEALGLDGAVFERIA